MSNNIINIEVPELFKQIINMEDVKKSKIRDFCDANKMEYDSKSHRGWVKVYFLDLVLMLHIENKYGNFIVMKSSTVGGEE